MNITKEDIKLLREYLIKYHIQQGLNKQDAKNKAEKMMKNNHNRLFGKESLSYWLASKSLPFFCLYYLQDTFRVKADNEARELSPTHYELWDTLEDMAVKDEFDKLVLCIPRGHAKSTVVTYALVVWLAVYEKSFYTIVQGKTEADAQKFLFDVRNTLEKNEYIIDTFGKLINSKKFTINKNELHLTSNCKVESLSSTSSMRGRKHLGKRPSFIILDDTQGLDDVITDQAKQKKMETFQKDVLYAGDTPVYRNGKRVKSGTKYCVIGTVLSTDCMISKLMQDKTYKTILKRGIPLDDFDADDYFNNNSYWAKFKEIYFDNKNDYAEIDAKNYYYDNEEAMSFPVLWREKYSPLDMALLYYSDPVSFKTEILNDARKVGEKCFFNVKTESVAEIESNEFERTILVADPAVGTKKRNDFTAIAVAGKVSSGHRYIREGLLLKVEFDDYIAKVIELLKKYPEISTVILEKNTYQGVDKKRIEEFIREDDELKHRNINILNNYQNKNKENKIRAVAGKINNGFFIFNENNQDFINQILDYQGDGIGHDDAADTIAEVDIQIDDEDNIIHPLSFKPREWLF